MNEEVMPSPPINGANVEPYPWAFQLFQPQPQTADKMKGSPCVFSSAAAIRSVFLNNAAPIAGPAHLQRLLLPSLATPSRQRSFFGRASPETERFPVGTFRRSPTLDRREPKATDGRILNYNIRGNMVVIRTKDGTLSEPQDKIEVLRNLDLNKSALEQIAEPHSGRPFPICRIILQGDEQKKAYTQMKAEKKKLQNGVKVVTKEVEMNWAMAPHDLATKIRRLKGFLEKGYRVEVTMMHPKKKSKRKANDEEAKQVFGEVIKVLEEVPGTTEYKSRQGQVGKTQLLFLQGKIPKAQPAAAGMESSPETADESAGEEKEAESQERSDTAGS
ncbi:uncharacterized protein QC763_205130 [Podospora pseudopauciseta]|uniref:Translation initiation factor IF-3 n=1 Tax=Podospora pseudopauciseta TaxID=2093780 RepID=A0ABR0HNP2_9PEZI|nr:hypothetical protein QC763_205130 [Podospora pseudopauciseta]